MSKILLPWKCLGGIVWQRCTITGEVVGEVGVSRYHRYSFHVNSTVPSLMGSSSTLEEGKSTVDSHLARFGFRFISEKESVML